VGVKLLDITEQPMGYTAAKKRKRQQDIEDAKRAADEANAAATQIKSEAAANPTPDYAANLATSLQPTTVPPPAYVPPPPTPQVPVTAPPPPVYAPVQSVTVPLATQPNALPGAPVTVALPTVPHPQVSAGTRIIQLPTQPLPQVRMTSISSPVNLGSNGVVTSGLTQSMTATRTVVQPQHIIMQQPRQTFIQTQPQQQILRQPAVQTIQAPAATQPGQRRNLSLTREQMLEAQEMFRTANKVTRPEKALILGFMAGSRDNPCPHLGSIVTIKLSENQENVPQNDNTYLTMIVETHFQMNYNTGEWKRIKKYRRLEDMLQ